MCFTSSGIAVVWTLHALIGQTSPNDYHTTFINTMFLADTVVAQLDEIAGWV